MEKIFELKRDISTPDSYIRAGVRRNEDDWRKVFPNLGQMNNHWFIDVTEVEELPEGVPQKIVDEVFSRFGLHSLSYKAVAIACIQVYKDKYENKPE